MNEFVQQQIEAMKSDVFELGLFRLPSVADRFLMGTELKTTRSPSIEGPKDVCASKNDAQREVGQGFRISTAATPRDLDPSA